MRMVNLSRRAIILTATAAVTLATVGTGVAAASTWRAGAHASHGTLLRSALIGRPKAADLDIAIRGVSPGGVPWTVERGTTRVDSNGELRAAVEGLLIIGTGTALDGTTGPVAKVVASVTCDGAASTVVTTDAVPLSAGGDAKIDEHVALPATCLAPIVLVRANSSAGPWIAVTGF